ncbi:MAG: CoA-binding protein [Methanomassiliicoccales archaeon]|nr:MAG: CoA-binding protein [Methanomassiliicoccales archaeon]
MSGESDLEFTPPPQEIKEILKNSKVIAVVGLSDNRMRPSNRIGRFLKTKGYKVIPVNPNYDTVIGLRSYSSLLDIPDEIDIVDIFRKPEAVDDVVIQAIKKGVAVVWMQEGVINKKAAKRAQEAGIVVVMDRCIYKEYDKHFMHG